MLTVVGVVGGGGSEEEGSEGAGVVGDIGVVPLPAAALLPVSLQPRRFFFAAAADALSGAFCCGGDGGVVVAATAAAAAVVAIAAAEEGGCGCIGVGSVYTLTGKLSTTLFGARHLRRCSLALIANIASDTQPRLASLAN